jgi:hypothetical protein
MDANPQLTAFWAEHPEYQHREREYFGFTLSYNPLQNPVVGQRAIFNAPNAQGQQRAADVIITGVSAEYLSNANSTFAPPNTFYPCSFQLAGEQYSITNIPTDISALCGFDSATQNAAAMPWPWPMIVPSGAQFVVLLDNPAGIVGTNVFLHFNALKVYV